MPVATRNAAPALRQPIDNLTHWCILFKVGNGATIKLQRRKQKLQLRAQSTKLKTLDHLPDPPALALFALRLTLPCCSPHLQDEAESFIKAAAAANHHHPTQPGAPPSPSSAAAAGAPFEPADPGHPHMPSPQATAAQPQSTQAQSQFTQSQQQQALQQQHQAAVRDALVEAGYPPDSSLPGTVLRLLLRHVAVAVVTRGVLGCVAARRGEGTGEQQQQQRQQGGGPQQQQQGVQGDEEDGEIGELRAVPAVPGVAVVDTTGAGDHFTAG